jgi:HSP20 family molecular chaperone IbpA
MKSFLEKLKKGMGIEENEKESEKKKILVENQEEKLEAKKEWLNQEGELMVDIYQTEEELFLQAPIAGVKASDLDIEIEGDTLIIKGERKNPAPENVDFIQKECYWGEFSRKIILPVEVDQNRIEAYFKLGILTIKFPKIQREKKKKIVPKE